MAEQRKKAVKITAGQIAAVLGVSPTMTDKQVMREMVRRHHFADSEYVSNIASDYYRDNVEFAALEFSKKYKTAIDRNVGENKHVAISASPFGFIESKKQSGKGLLVVLCPFGQRDTDQFKSIDDQPHHYAKAMVEAYVCGCNWVLFYQWSIVGMAVHVEPLNEKFVEESLGVLFAFYERYKEEAKKPDLHLEPLRKSIDNKDARRLIEERDELTTAVGNAAARVKEIDELLRDLCGDKSAIICGRLMTRVESEGSISYAMAVKDLLPGADLSKYKGAPSISWKFT